MFIYGVFEEEEAASDAVQRLVDADFPSEDIRAIMQQGDQVEELSVEGKTSTGRGLVIGGILGVLVGALAAVIADLGAAEPWIDAIKGAVVGGAIGIALGALSGLAFWREEVDFLHRRLKQGAVLIGVETNPGRRASVEEVLRASGAKELHVRDQQVALGKAMSQ